ncbi:substrate-binding domain-containing protein [Neomegalonema sp.]|uniref:substrate-binding domain-containing protein n=1 Tax=Neomegalonema sp. TaxID=2039713 RepID=UPI00262900EF|nr:substrate-binding domain-containing protein [Neomegalonema sp.]MDD2867377.1 substrate-binding domain-containing protein [Neomegalonema sp.]
MKKLLFLLVLLAAAGALYALSGRAPKQEEALRILAGSEAETFKPLLDDWSRESGVRVDLVSRGSVEIAQALGAGRAMEFDAVWPASSLWISFGDESRVTRHAKSIARSPVVFGVRRSIAQKLGWTGDREIPVAEIGAAVSSGEMRLAMTSATQSNSGASAYFGFLHAFAGGPDLIETKHLRDPEVQERTREFLAGVDRSSGSSNWLKDSLIASFDAYDSMVNYEALILDADRQLTARGAEPLHLVYPADGLAIADSTLAYVDRGDAAQEARFLALQEFLLSPAIQKRIVETGWRAGLIGAQAPEGGIWRRDWGVDPARVLSPIPFPQGEAVGEALRLYQSELRKPSLTIWLADVSGSMQGEPLAELKRAMTMALDPEQAALSLLQPSARDVTIVIPFASGPGAPLEAEGDDPKVLGALLSEVEALEAGG